jgi:hypothetical protein
MPPRRNKRNKRNKHAGRIQIQNGRIQYNETEKVYRCKNCKLQFRNCRSFGGHKGKCQVSLSRKSEDIVVLLENPYDHNIEDDRVPHEVEHDERMEEGRQTHTL